MGDPLTRIRKSSTYASARLVALFVLAAPAFAESSHNLLQNGEFTSGIAGWTLETDAGFSLTWNPAMGNPSPGSLRLSGTYQGLGIGVAEALSECIDAPPDTTFHVQTTMFASTADGAIKCVPFITRYEGTGCTGQRTRLGFHPPIEPTSAGRWHTEATQAVTSAALPSFRVSLFFWLLNGEEPASCHFDSVVLVEDGADVADIPADSTVGVILFIVCLGLAASRLLRTPA